MINLSLKQSIKLFLEQPTTEDTNTFLCIGEKHASRTPPTQKMFEDYLDECRIVFQKEPVGNHVTYRLTYPISLHGFDVFSIYQYHPENNKWFFWGGSDKKWAKDILRGLLDKLTDAVDDSYIEALAGYVQAARYFEEILYGIHGDEHPVRLSDVSWGCSQFLDLPWGHRKPIKS